MTDALLSSAFRSVELRENQTKGPVGGRHHGSSNPPQALGHTARSHVLADFLEKGASKLHRQSPDQPHGSAADFEDIQPDPLIDPDCVRTRPALLHCSVKDELLL